MKLKEIRTRHIIKGLNKLTWDYLWYMLIISAVVIAVKPDAFLGTMEYSTLTGTHTFAAFVYSLQSKLMGYRIIIILAMVFELIRTNWAWIEKNIILVDPQNEEDYFNTKFKYKKYITKLKRMIRW